MKMIVGLGNPGKEYAGTRHNMGFEVIGLLSRQYCADRPKSKFHAEFVEINVQGERVLLLSPLTYMNRSGLSVIEAKNFYKLDNSDILVVCDDMDLPVGKIRCRKTGSSGGQKGLGDIVRLLGTENVTRIRLGIGHPEPGRPAPDYVLGSFPPEDKPLVAESVEQAAKAAVVWATKGSDACMNQFN